MEIFILLGILALLMFGPRRGGRWPGRVATLAGVLFFIWVFLALGMGFAVRSIIGPIAQP